MLDDRFYFMPPDNEAEKFSVCIECGEEIYYGETYYTVDSEHYCEDCGDFLFKSTAGED